MAKNAFMQATFDISLALISTRRLRQFYSYYIVAFSPGAVKLTCEGVDSTQARYGEEHVFSNQICHRPVSPLAAAGIQMAGSRAAFTNKIFQNGQPQIS